MTIETDPMNGKCGHCARRDQEALSRSIDRMKQEVVAAMTIETDMSVTRFANDAIGMFLEYRDVHGQDEEQARASAVEEMRQGIEAEKELRTYGEIK
jgi:predicted transcriptional regulator YheO